MTPPSAQSTPPPRSDTSVIAPIAARYLPPSSGPPPRGRGKGALLKEGTFPTYLALPSPAQRDTLSTPASGQLNPLRAGRSLTPNWMAAGDSGTFLRRTTG